MCKYTVTGFNNHVVKKNVLPNYSVPLYSTLYKQPLTWQIYIPSWLSIRSPAIMGINNYLLPPTLSLSVLCTVFLSLLGASSISQVFQECPTLSHQPWRNYRRGCLNVVITGGWWVYGPIVPPSTLIYSSYLRKIETKVPMRVGPRPKEVYWHS
jgi:hypothetical protein